MKSQRVDSWTQMSPQSSKEISMKVASGASHRKCAQWLGLHWPRLPCMVRRELSNGRRVPTRAHHYRLDQRALVCVLSRLPEDAITAPSCLATLAQRDSAGALATRGSRESAAERLV